jgi:Tfp pilus assembly protein PilO
VAVGFDEYLEKYEDAVDLYDVYVRKQFTNIEEALTFILNSLPLAAERLRSS